MSTFSLASGQTQLSDAKQAIEQAFWQNLYGNGGTTLYCGQAFARESGTLTASPIYSSKQLKSAMRCVTGSSSQMSSAAQAAAQASGLPVKDEE